MLWSRRFVARLITATAFWVLTPCLTSVSAAADYLGRPVVAVEVARGAAQTQDPALLDVIVTQVGMPLSMEQVRESILHLFSLGQFRDIQVDASERNGGVALRYLVLPVQRVEAFEFRGTLGLSRRLLRDEIRARYGELPALDRVADAVRLLEALYRDHGYMNARVAVASSAEPEDGRTTLVFEIDARAQARVASLVVEGSPLLAPAQLFNQLGLRVGMVYDRSAVERRLADYADALRERGHYEAVLDHAIDMEPRTPTVDLTVHVDPGPLVSVEFDGDRLPSQVRDELVPVAIEGSVDRDLLEDSTLRLAAYLRGQGFWRAEVSYTRDEAESDLRVVFRIDRGRLYRIAEPEIIGNLVLAREEVLAVLGVQAGDRFVESEFQAGVTALAEAYRRAGYARVEVAREIVEETPQTVGGGSSLVTPHVAIAEGPRIMVGSVALEGAPPEEERHLASLVSAPDQPYVRAQAIADRDAILQDLLNHGYEAASVQVDAAFDDEQGRAELIFVVEPGPQVFVDHVLIVGQTHISASTIRREMTLEPGQPLGRDQLVESQRRLGALGLFRRIRIIELRHEDETRRDILVSVEEAPATTLGYGGGFEAGTRLRRGRSEGGRAVERIEFAPRGFFEIGRRNLWGKNRSADLFTRVSLRPRNDPNVQDDASEFGFNEFRVLGTFREPRVFGTTAEVLVTAFVEQSIRSSFNLHQRGVHAEWRRSLGPRFVISGGYSFDQNKLFDERFNLADQPLIDRLFPEIRLSAFSGTLVRDSRDDPFEPTRGTLVSVDTETAGRHIGSEVGFAKTLMQGFVYRRVAGSRDVIFAGGIRVGLAAGFPRDVVEIDAAGSPVLGSAGEPLTTEVQDLPASERFFGGGDTTVRGFALDRLGDEATIDQDGFPQGGSGLIILNTELRMPLWGSVGAVAFLDAGNVFETVGDFGLGRLRGAAGFGVRYRSPIGPIRVDLGFKLDRREFPNGTREGLTALHVSIGQAF